MPRQRASIRVGISETRLRRFAPLIATTGAATTFTPTSISGLTAWYDFSDAATLYTDAGTTLVASDGDLIYQVTDKSGSGHYAVQTSSGARPSYKVGIQNGLSVGRFAGSQFMLAGAPFTAGETAQSVVMVIKEPGGTTLYGALARTESTNNIFQIWIDQSATLIKARLGTGSGTYDETWTSPSAGWHVFSAVVSTSSAIYGDGTVRSSGTGTPSISTTTGIGLGTRSVSALVSGYVGDIGEVLIFNVALSAGDRSAVEHFVGNKWNIAVA